VLRIASPWLSNQSTQLWSVPDHWPESIGGKCLSQFNRRLNHEERAGVHVHEISDRIEKTVSDPHLARLLHCNARAIGIGDGVHDLLFIRRFCGDPLARLSTRFTREDSVAICPFAQRQFRRWSPQ